MTGGTKTVMRIVELAAGGETPFDGQYLKEYDPGRDGADPTGEPMLAHMVTTPDATKAMMFDSLQSMLDEWARVDPRRPVREDGSPNQPLKAFTVSSESVPEEALNT